MYSYIYMYIYIYVYEPVGGALFFCLNGCNQMSFSEKTKNLQNGNCAYLCHTVS